VTGSDDVRGPFSSHGEVIREGEDAFIVARGDAVASSIVPGSSFRDPHIARERAEDAPL
jgi:hypothetical protein